MKPFLVLFIALNCCLAEDKKDSGAPQEVKASKDNVSLKVEYQAQYADAQACTLSYRISNTSGKPHVTVFSGRAFDPDIQVRLVAPSGKVLSAYKDMPGAQFHAIPPSALFTEELTGRGYDHYLDLHYLFPLEETGEYHCTLTKRVFHSNAGAPGTPVDLVTPEFKFSVQTVDANERSPLAKLVPSLNSPKPAAPVVQNTTPQHHASHLQEHKKSGASKP
jgi:hypothetical protein